MSTLVYILATLLLFTIIVAVHEFGHMIVAKLFGVGVVEYSIGMGPVIYSKRKKDTCYSVRALPIGGFCAMYGEKSLEADEKGKEESKKSSRCDYKTDWCDDQRLVSKSWWQRLLIYLAGPAVNVLCGFLVCIILVASTGAYGHLYVMDVADGGSAQEQGVQADDLIVGINDRDVVLMIEYQGYNSLHINDKSFDLHVLRDGKPLTFHVTRNEEDLIGITMAMKPDVHNIGDVVYFGSRLFRSYLYATVDGISMLFSGGVSINDMSSVVGVTATVTNTLEETEVEARDSGESVFRAIALSLLSIFALLTINIGLMNLIPIPALDGGRILFCLIEAVIRRPISPKVEYAVNTVSMVLLLIFMGYVLVGDIVKIVLF